MCNVRFARGFYRANERTRAFIIHVYQDFFSVNIVTEKFGRVMEMREMFVTSL